MGSTVHSELTAVAGNMERALPLMEHSPQQETGKETRAELTAHFFPMEMLTVLFSLCFLLHIFPC